MSVVEADLQSPEVLSQMFYDVLTHKATLTPDLVNGLVAQIAAPSDLAESANALRAASQVCKVSISLPKDLVTDLRRRVGRGEFSRYVAEAVKKQLEQDLLTELSEWLEAQYGPVPEELIAEAEAVWQNIKKG